MRNGALKLGGDVWLKVVRTPKAPMVEGVREVSFREIVRLGAPRLGLPEEVNDWRLSNLRELRRGARDVRLAGKIRAPVLLGFLHLTKIGRDGRRIDLGLASASVVTTAWVNELIDALQDAGVSFANEWVFHGIGTGGTAEAAGDTALVTELTTQYQTDNTRATGTNVEGASANIYQSVGTNTVDAVVAITEHGLFNDATVGLGTLMDRSLFAAVNLGSGESLQSTYELTASAGG